MVLYLYIDACFPGSYAAKGVTEQKKMFEASLSMKIPLLVAFRKGFNEVGFEGAKALNPHSSQLFVVHLFSGNFNQKQKKHTFLLGNLFKKTWTIHFSFCQKCLFGDTTTSNSHHRALRPWWNAGNGEGLHSIRSKWRPTKWTHKRCLPTMEMDHF